MEHSPSRSMSPKKSPKKQVTRYGPIKEIQPKFGTEERFAWQNAKNTNDVVYNLPEMKMNRSITFASSLRLGLSDDNPDSKKNSTGPGSYDVSSSFNALSTIPRKNANRFGGAPRQSMAMKTPSPGAVYNIEHLYKDGPQKPNGIGFVNASRDPLYGSSNGANADLFFPKPSTGPEITIAARFKPKQLGQPVPGAIYEVHKKLDFRTGPAFSFGRGKSSRFKEINFLPEKE